MTQTLPKWLANRYSVLWKEYKDGKFTFEQAKKTLGESDSKTLSVILSSMRKRGWLIVELDPETSRKRLYMLKSPDMAVEEIAEEYSKSKGARD